MMPADQRGSDCATRIARGGLDPEALERSLAKEPAIAHAVERDAARQAEIFRTGRLLRVAGHLQDDLLGHILNRTREIHLALRQLRLRRPPMGTLRTRWFHEHVGHTSTM